MKFKLDENMPRSAATLLSSLYDSVDTVAGEGMRGAKDARIASACREEGRVLLTLDLDFANVSAYPPREYAGIVVFRTRDQSQPVVMVLIRQLLGFLAHEAPVGQLWIVEPGRIRVHGRNA